MTDLKDIVLAAHGDIARWRSYSTLTAHVVNGGALWGMKGQDGVLQEYTASIELHRQFASHAPFGEPGLRSSFTPQRAAVETTDGTVLEERVDPRSAFAGHALETQWDRLHAAYFTGYAMWTYLTEPFQFAEPGFAFAELAPGKRTARRGGASRSPGRSGFTPTPGCRPITSTATA